MFPRQLLHKNLFYAMSKLVSSRLQINSDNREYKNIYKISEITVDKLKQRSYNTYIREIAIAKVVETTKSKPLARRGVPVESWKAL
ncbi:MAG: hypothetical protein XD78_0911 [Desulfotomaculum sp. 46_296]|nr:MAG: hypothetical protein XD78_0911 [Desulfotomaculum sp. 46_296]